MCAAVTAETLHVPDLAGALFPHAGNGYFVRVQHPGQVGVGDQFQAFGGLFVQWFLRQTHARVVDPDVNAAEFLFRPVPHRLQAVEIGQFSGKTQHACAAWGLFQCCGRSINGVPVAPCDRDIAGALQEFFGKPAPDAARAPGNDHVFHCRNGFTSGTLSMTQSRSG